MLKGGQLVRLNVGGNQQRAVETTIQEVDRVSKPNLYRCSSVGKKNQLMHWYKSTEFVIVSEFK